MKGIRPIDPRHEQSRNTLRVVGAVLTFVGLALTGIGLVSFFSAFGTHEFPRYFWCAFLGLPLFGVGLSMLQFGYLGSIARYFSGEAAPVQKDTFNYLAEGMSPGVRTMAKAVSQGLAEGVEAPSATTEVPCPHCQAPNTQGSKFCNQCGAALSV
jgi:hypothetical protein